MVDSKAAAAVAAEEEDEQCPPRQQRTLKREVANQLLPKESHKRQISRSLPVPICLRRNPSRHFILVVLANRRISFQILREKMNRVV
jgi:hypothetical protein